VDPTAATLPAPGRRLYTLKGRDGPDLTAIMLADGTVHWVPEIIEPVRGPARDPAPAVPEETSKPRARPRSPRTRKR
jgi:hypothetical protein